MRLNVRAFHDVKNSDTTCMKLNLTHKTFREWWDDAADDHREGTQ